MEGRWLPDGSTYQACRVMPAGFFVSRDQPPGFDAQLPLAAGRDLAVVGDEDQGRAGFAVELEHQLHHRRAGGEIEAAGGLVGQQQGRAQHKGPRQRHALLLTARQHARVMAEPLAQAHACQHRSSLLARVAFAAQFQRQHHVLQRRQVGQQLKALEHEAQFACPHGGALVLVEGEQVLATQLHAALARRVQAGQDGQQRALTGARGADDGDRLLSGQHEADVMQNRQLPGRVAHALGDSINLDKGFGHVGTAAAGVGGAL
mmetsp:Transcript_57661/g.135730  ORF Transcript_57661/g.135730 Transcript_57661/m.135730 type:complete len:261 (-) Transcript_57661:227-1009(-)